MYDQHSLFDHHHVVADSARGRSRLRAFARATDPWQSWAAAAHVDVTSGQAKVLYLFALANRAMTDDELVDAADTHHVPISPSGARSRRKELLTKGYLRRLPVSGRSHAGHAAARHELIPDRG